MKNFIQDLFFLLCFLSLVHTGCNSDNTMIEKESILYEKAAKIGAPVPKKEEKILEIHGDKRIDDYYWMRLTDEQKNAKSPDEHTKAVVSYLEEENAYTDKVTSHLSTFKEELYEEIVGRIKQTDMSVPYFSNGYYYLSRYEEGNEYPIHSRKKGNLEAEEEIMLNVNTLAKNYEFYNVGGRSVSPNNEILAYGEDTLSRRIYTVKFKNLETGEYYTDVIENTTGGITWANDNKTVFYTRKDEALRSFKIFKHILGTDVSKDTEIYHEKDETFSTFVYKTKSKKYIIIGSYSTLSQEYRYLDADTPNGNFSIFQPRERKLEYSIDHKGDKWYVKTNKDAAKNFKLMLTDLDKTSKEHWVDFIAHREDVLLEDVDLFDNFFVLSERHNGITKLRVNDWAGKHHFINFGEDAYMAYTTANPEFETDILRIGYTSLTTPNSTFDYNMNTKDKELLKQQEVVGSFDSKNYSSERIFASADDGTQVPISLVYRNGFKKDGSSPVLLYGYGSYGSSMDPYFSSVRLSLLDRGFVFAIAHIRGGEEMGRHWYEGGKLLNKKNTFTDFIACGKHLTEQKYANEDKLFAMGGSAGGLLMGAVYNMAPEMWKGLVSAVPFVDVITTMLDETIPLTTGEFDEWGNPKNLEYYNYIKSYSPYDNVESKEYPAMLVTTGYHDSQVQYWEPAKWVAKLRDKKTDGNPLLLKTNMEAGHGGKSGRFRRLEEAAFEYAFFLDLAGWDESEFKN